YRPAAPQPVRLPPVRPGTGARVHRGIAVAPPARRTPRQNGRVSRPYHHISRAGFPPHRACAGTSSPFMRKESAASTDPSPIVTPQRMNAPTPTVQPAPSVLRPDLSVPSSCAAHWFLLWLLRTPSSPTAVRV